MANIACCTRHQQDSPAVTRGPPFTGGDGVACNSQIVTLHSDCDIARQSHVQVWGAGAEKHAGVQQGEQHQVLRLFSDIDRMQAPLDRRGAILEPSTCVLTRGSALTTDLVAGSAKLLQ